MSEETHPIFRLLQPGEENFGLTNLAAQAGCQWIHVFYETVQFMFCNNSNNDGVAALVSTGRYCWKTLMA
jgi:hypothetical protein